MANTKATASETGRALVALRHKKLSKARRSEIARQAAVTRWRRYRARKEQTDASEETT